MSGKIFVGIGIDYEKMKIIHENPPDKLLNAIINNGMHPHSLVIYTYGDTIYNPSGTDIPDHLLIHEETHCEQQGNDPKGWWIRYLIDQYFRIEQETEAYTRQFAYICTTVKDRNQRHRICLDLAKILAGPIYGNVIGQMNVYQKIKSLSKVKP